MISPQTPNGEITYPISCLNFFNYTSFVSHEWFRLLFKENVTQIVKLPSLSSIELLTSSHLTKKLSHWKERKIWKTTSSTSLLQTIYYHIRHYCDVILKTPRDLLSRVVVLDAKRSTNRTSHEAFYRKISLKTNFDKTFCQKH